MLKLYFSLFALLTLSGCATLEEDSWIPVQGRFEFSDTMKGKTLINFENCMNSKEQECETVLYLGKDPVSGFLYPAIEVNFAEKKIIDTTWGYSGFSSSIKLGERRFNGTDINYLHRQVSFSPDKQLLKIEPDDSKKSYIYAVKGEDYSYLNSAKSKGFSMEKGAKMSNFFGELAGKAIIGAANSIAEASRNGIGANSQYTSCVKGDTCFEVIERKSDYRYKIRCTKGTSIGRENDVCGRSDGKWASGCGLSDTFAFHAKSMAEAANDYCD